jgi:GT2 family glycosyltransferase
VLNYLTPDDTFLAVRALLMARPRPQELIVVDNDPDGGCEQALAAVRGDIVYVAPGKNLGFSGGMNLGIRSALASGADYVVLVNSDVLVTPDCLDTLQKALEATPGAGIAGPMVLARSAPDTIASLGLSFDHRTGRMQERSARRRRQSPASLGPHTSDAVSGCCMFVAREVFATVGLLDEDYFFGFEDIDFCLSARALGFTTLVVPGAVVYHEGSRSIGAASPLRLYFAARNHLRLAQRTAPAGPVGSFVRGLSILGLNLAHAARHPIRSVPAGVGAVLRGTYHHLTSQYGSGS